MSESIQVALLTLFGVVVGSVLTFIPALIQGNREKIKFQKEIFESRFLKLEKHLEKYLNIAKEASRAEERDTSTRRKLEDTLFLDSVLITNDSNILKDILEIRVASTHFINYVIGIEDDSESNDVIIGLEDDSESNDYIDIRSEYLLIKEVCSNLLRDIDKFRLNDYKPRKKPLSKRISELVKKKKKEQ